MEKDHIRALFAKYLANSHTRKELDELLHYFNIDDDKIFLKELVSEELAKHDVVSENEELIETIAKNLELKIFKPTRTKPKIKRLLPYISVAAFLSIGLAFTYYFYILQKENPSAKIASQQIDVAPGSNKAILFLSDGSTINLNQVRIGEIANQSGVKISKASDGQISYNTSENSTSSNTFNSVVTPKGGQYQVRLPDGTKVWLNAASSLKYPTSFANLKERKVELSGEAYFEVAHNKKMPFRVVTATQTVEVLGTHFNINSYADEKATATTLVEGSVKVLTPTGQKMIIPGQQSLTSQAQFTVQQADLETALAWKENNIIFKSADIQSIMRQVERWYDVDVEYEGKISKRLFTGGMPRNTKLSVLLDVLKENNISFEIIETGQRKKLIVKP